MRATTVLAFALLCSALLVSCSDDKKQETDADTEDIATDGVVDLGDARDADQADLVDEAVTVMFDLGTDRLGKDFFDYPYPSDLRLTATGGPDIGNIGNPRDIDVIEPLIDTAGDRPGFPVIGVGWFRFTGEIPRPTPETIIPPSATADLMLVDVDPASPNRGTLYPVVARGLWPDPYVPDNVLAVAAQQGILLHPLRTYAFVVRTSFGDVDGNPLGVHPDIAALAAGETPAGTRGAEIAAHQAPAWDTLDQIGVDRSTVAALAVFTTGDVIRDQLFEVSERIRENFDATIFDLQVPARGTGWDRICEIHGTMTVPEFQQGTPPFDTGGLFEMGTDGVPVLQFETDIPIVISLPKQEMPAGGFPLVMYFHGSGGIATQLVDRGPIPMGSTMEEPGKGPAYVVAEHGFAMVGSAHPVNPERVAGAVDIEYLNFNNLAALRDVFRQGVSEQRLFLDALMELEIDPAMVAGCAGLTLPAGETMFRFADDPVIGMGQSMGGMYTNLVGAVEPRIKAVVPTGAGGFWLYFIMETTLVPGQALIPLLLQADEDADFLHPFLHLITTAYEVSDPMVAMPRLAQNPLEGHPIRPVYEPVGKGDSYFPIQLFDAIALAYGHQQAGEIVWPTMQDSLAAKGLDGIVPYPVTNNVSSGSGESYTGVVVQYEGDGWTDPHGIYAQLDDVKYQIGCFIQTFRMTGTAVVPAPAPLGTPCPGLP